MSRFLGHYYLAKLRPDDLAPKPPHTPPPPGKDGNDWDKGALLITAMVLIPVVAAVAVVALLAI